MTREPERVPDWLLERLALDELAPERKAEVLRRLASEPDGMERLRALDNHDRAILLAHPPGRVAEEIRRRAGLTRATRGRWTLLVPAAAALVAMVAVVVPWPAAHTLPAPEQAATGDREKGLQPFLVVHRQTSGGAERLGQGEVARAGDTLQIGYVSDGAPYGAILSVDGRGVVTLHWPREADGVGALEPRGATSLPEAYVLDDAPDFERFFLVTGDEPVDPEAVLAAARRLAEDPDLARVEPLRLPPGLTQASFIVAKP